MANLSKRGRVLMMSMMMIALAVGLAYQYRLELLIFGLPRVQAIAEPVSANQPVVWQTTANALGDPKGMAHQQPLDQLVEAARGEEPIAPEQNAQSPMPRPPNIIVILADDMGFNDVSFYNGGAADGSLQTPHIDAIAHNGIAFDNGYAGNAVCAPSRAMIMTGRYSTRFGYEYTPFFKIGLTIFDWMQQAQPGLIATQFNYEEADKMPGVTAGMPSSEITIAEQLRERGYHTVHIGKWHLGATGDEVPNAQGFDESLTMKGGLYLPEDSPDVVNMKQPFDTIDNMVWATAKYAASYNDGELFEPKGYLTDYYTDEAVKVIAANKERPFFLYLAHWGIHNPLQAKRSDYEALAHIQDERLRVYAAMTLALDRGVGRVMQALKDQGIYDNTLVVFTSDNGGAGYLGLPDINKPFRGWKLNLFEGGIHVPFMMQWPEALSPGMRYAPPVSHLDIFSTVLAAAGATEPTDRPIDGVNLIPHLNGTLATPPRDTLFWREGHHQAVLHQGWKLIVSKNRRWLFKLHDDPTEQNNLIVSEGSRAEELTALLAEHNAEQVEPLWPSAMEGPQWIDKTGAEPKTLDDEYVIWPN